MKLGTLRGYAARFDVLSCERPGCPASGGETHRVRFARGAFRKPGLWFAGVALNIPLLLSHRAELKAGRLVELAEDGMGLRIAADVFDDRHGRRLPECCAADGFPIRERVGSVALSVSVVGRACRSREDGGLVLTYEDVEDVCEVSALLPGRQAALWGSWATFSLEPAA